jgi:hypothetical protein
VRLPARVDQPRVPEFLPFWSEVVSETLITTELVVNRRAADRRITADRRHAEGDADFTGPERRASTRRKVERRRQIDPTTCERDYTDDEVDFMKAMDEYKRKAGRQFPTWSEVLEVIRSLGYRKVAEPTRILN